jgi:peptidoglycan/LPS O-acetylase OafA/YrhL
LALLLLFFVPFIPGLTPICYNGLFEMFCIAIIFPFLIWFGASGSTTDRLSSGICKFLGDISFPVYIIHYPLYYLFYAWLIKNQYYTFEETWLVALSLIIVNMLLAYICLKFYDEPVRKWLAKRFLKKSVTTYR